jgi:N-acetylglucosaminyl-diphospho-decaprenol L-rhamnosyltransferase
VHPSTGPAPDAAPRLTVSVVSHGHEAVLPALLGQLARDGRGVIAQVVVTHNKPAQPLPLQAEWPFAVTEVFNPAPLGFGANHNRAFGQCRTEQFGILNPDIEAMDPDLWPALAEAAGRLGVGCAYPRLLNPDGSVQNEREAVTPLALMRRHVFKASQRRTDWVSGALWVVPAAAWRALGGFDERYFMYCEDADFCLRLQLAGWQLARVEPTARHAAAWASRKPGRAMGWHLRSLLRFWTQPVLWRYLARPVPRSGTVEKARQ